MKTLHMVAFALVIIGAINWGLFGIADLNLVDSLLGSESMVTKLVYVLVGLSGLWLATTHMQDCKMCASKKK